VLRWLTLQAYENYSFEELRYASPTLRRPTENMLVRDNGDGSYTASWTPATSGLYHVLVKLDDFDAGMCLSFIGFTYFLLLSIPSLSTRIVPLRFQAGRRS